MWQTLDHAPFLLKLIETASENLYRRDRKLIRKDPSQEQASSDISGTNPPGQSPAKQELLSQVITRCQGRFSFETGTNNETNS